MGHLAAFIGILTETQKGLAAACSLFTAGALCAIVLYGFTGVPKRMDSAEKRIEVLESRAMKIDIMYCVLTFPAESREDALYSCPRQVKSLGEG